MSQERAERYGNYYEEGTEAYSNFYKKRHEELRKAIKANEPLVKKAEALVKEYPLLKEARFFLMAEIGSWAERGADWKKEALRNLDKVIERQYSREKDVDIKTSSTLQKIDFWHKVSELPDKMSELKNENIVEDKAEKVENDSRWVRFMNAILLAIRNFRFRFFNHS